jgi:hypothetical protein
MMRHCLIPITTPGGPRPEAYASEWPKVSLTTKGFGVEDPRMSAVPIQIIELVLTLQ